MTRMIKRTTLLILFACCTVFIAKAQLGYDFSKYDIGVAGGFNKVYGDAETIISKPSVHFSITINQTPFVNYVFEAQIGQMAGGDTSTKSGWQFASSFSSYQLRGQLQAGELIDYSQGTLANAMKNLYVSAGLGIIYSQISSINRFSTQVPGFYTGGEDKANQVFLALRIGYEFKLYNSYNQPSFKIDVGYEYNSVFGDQLDGFKTGKTNDAFDQIYIGVKFAFGEITSYRKQITR
jgi:hypothetical protein